MSQPSVIGVPSSGLSLQSTIQSGINVPASTLSSLTLPSNISLNLNPLNQTGSIANTIRSTSEFAQNLVMQRNAAPTNGIDIEHVYRSQPAPHRNGYQRDTECNDLDSFFNSRVSEYEEEQSLQREQRENNVVRSVMEEQRLVKPAPLQARLLSVVTPDPKDSPIKTVYVIPQPIADKKYFFIKNEPPETIQVSLYSCI